jgi:hypothetical protein
MFWCPEALDDFFGAGKQPNYEDSEVWNFQFLWNPVLTKEIWVFENNLYIFLVVSIPLSTCTERKMVEILRADCAIISLERCDNLQS